MRFRCRSRAVAALIAFAACHKEPVVDRTPRPAPPGVLVTISTSGAQLAGLRAYVHAVKPGMEVVLGDAVLGTQLATLVTAQSLAGLDLSGPIDVVIVSDLPGDGQANGAAVVAKVKDEAALNAAGSGAKVTVRDGWAVVGPTAVVGEIAPWALTTLRSDQRETVPTAVVRVGQVLRRFRAEIAAGRQTMRAQLAAQPGGASTADLMDAYIDGAFSIVGDADEVRVRLDANALSASLDVALAPKPGSRLAALVALEQPNDFALLSALPAGDNTAVIAGRLLTGPYHAGMMAALGKIFGTPVVTDATEALLQASTGELAMTMSGSAGGVAFTYVYGASDAPAIERAIAAVMHAFTGLTMEISGIGMTYTAVPGSEHDGVQLSAYETTMDVSKLAPQARPAFPTAPTRTYLGVFDGHGVVSAGPGSLDVATRTIDAARGKGPHYTPPLEVEQLLTDARARKESVAAVLDIATIRALLPGGGSSGASASAGHAPAMMTLGFADHDAHLRIALPAATLATLVPR